MDKELIKKIVKEYLYWGVNEEQLNKIENLEQATMLILKNWEEYANSYIKEEK